MFGESRRLIESGYGFKIICIVDRHKPLQSLLKNIFFHFRKFNLDFGRLVVIQQSTEIQLSTDRTVGLDAVKILS